MTSDGELEAPIYTFYVFDCPACGGQTYLGDVDPGPTAECDDCGAEVRMTQ